MRFIESTSFFVRTIVFDFWHRSKEIKLKFKLVPMVHIGSKNYYEEVYIHLNQCDEILYEAAMLPYSRAYKHAFQKLAKKLNLVTQIEHFNYASLKHKLIHADYDKSSGNTAYDKLNWKEKIIFSILKPLSLHWHSRGITRTILAEALRPSARDYLRAYGPLPDVEGTAENLIVRSRDNLVLNLMKEKLEKEGAVDKTIGIMYGAYHMNYLSNFLTVKKGFVPNNAQFVKVFDVL